MNRYGRQVQEAWWEASPTHYAQIQDPETFFRELGEQAAEQIDQMQTQLAGLDPEGRATSRRWDGCGRRGTRRGIREPRPSVSAGDRGGRGERESGPAAVLGLEEGWEADTPADRTGQDHRATAEVPH